MLRQLQLYYLQEGFREGLAAAAMEITEELDSPEFCDSGNTYWDAEEQWWHTHNDKEGDIGSPERL